jgi:hypothetical protein
MTLLSELQSDESTDTKVQLPANARVDTDSDTVSNRHRYAASGRERALA